MYIMDWILKILAALALITYLMDYYTPGRRY